MTITAVVVTYNRLILLQECIAAIQKQSVQPSYVVVINNSSTDGTTGWLQTQTHLNTIQQPNKGGAWGFYTGIKEAYKTGADWFWIMDDDTIADATALEELLKAMLLTSDEEHDDFGFFASEVVWTDGSLHLMNKPQADKNFKGKKTFEYYRQQGILPLIYNSFVSVLIRKEAVEKTGLPIKEFFIWNDDIEYTQRIIQAGFAGGLVKKSRVLHKTPVNNASDIFTDSKTNLWKYRYGLRNELYTRRYKKGYGSYMRNVLKRLFVFPFKILAKRKTDQWPFIKMVWQSTFDALKFDPKKEHIINSDKP